MGPVRQYGPMPPSAGNPFTHRTSHVSEQISWTIVCFQKRVSDLAVGRAWPVDLIQVGPIGSCRAVNLHDKAVKRHYACLCPFLYEVFAEQSYCFSTVGRSVYFLGSYQIYKADNEYVNSANSSE